MATMENVIFYSEGDEVTGTIFIPGGLAKGETRAGIVIAGGYIGTKEMSYGPTAELSGEGYVTLTFDYRGGVGESKLRGTENPPGIVRLFPEASVQDVRSAVTYLATRREVNPERIGLLGQSAGGSYVVSAAAVEPRVKCIICEGGIGDGYRWARSNRRSWEFRNYIRKIEEDKLRRVSTGNSAAIPNSEFMLFNPAETESWSNIAKYFPKMAQLELKTPLEVCERWLEYKPEVIVNKISPRPILFIGEETSDLVPPEEVPLFYERAGEPKSLVIVPASIVPSRYEKFRLAEGARYIPWIWNHMIEWFRRFMPPC